MFEKRKAEQAHRAAEHAVAIWESQQKQLEQMQSLVQALPFVSHELPGSLVEFKAARGQFEGRSQGVSLHIAKGVNYRVGAMKGHYVPGPESWTVVDTGKVTVDSDGVTFVGGRLTRQWMWKKVLDFVDGDDFTAIAVSNRQKTSGVGFATNATMARFLLRLGYASAMGRRSELEQFVNEELSAHAAKRPAELAIAAPPSLPQPPSSTAQIAAGWYPDGSGQPLYRWWDGIQWTTATQPHP